MLINGSDVSESSYYIVEIVYGVLGSDVSVLVPDPTLVYGVLGSDVNVWLTSPERLIPNVSRV